MNITVTNFIDLSFQSHISIICGIFIRGRVSFHTFLLNGEYSNAITRHSAAVESYTLWQAVSHEHKRSPIWQAASRVSVHQYSYVSVSILCERVPHSAGHSIQLAINCDCTPCSTFVQGNNEHPIKVNDMSV